MKFKKYIAIIALSLLALISCQPQSRVDAIKYPVDTYVLPSYSSIKTDGTKLAYYGGYEFRIGGHIFRLTEGGYVFDLNGDGAIDFSLFIEKIEGAGTEGVGDDWAKVVLRKSGE